MSYDHLRALLDKADAIDLRDGMSAYSTYHKVIENFALAYGAKFEPTLAAFCALSPQNDYYGNLRSLASVLSAVQHSIPVENVIVSTYSHCRNRAYSYLTGSADFLSSVKGLKIRAFYANILDPADPIPVTIDGHMVCAWRGINVPMKAASVRPSEYDEIAKATRELADDLKLIPNQLQAIIWLTRKRLERIKYNPQLKLFGDDIRILPMDAPPYTAA